MGRGSGGHREHTRGQRPTRTNTQRVRKKDREQDGAPDGCRSRRFNNEAEGEGRAAEQEESQVWEVGDQSEEPRVLQEKISAIHVDPEALI